MGARILLADDSLAVHRMVKQALINDDVELIAFSNGDQAAKELQERKPDLVIADIFMPGLDGYQLCQTVRESSECGHIPVILLVGTFEPFDVVMASRVGADTHLIKPFQPEKFAETVRTLLDGGGTRRPIVTPENSTTNRSYN